MENKKVLNKQQQEFQFILSRFSHEIRNPVSLLNSELQMIAASHPEVTAYTYWGDVLDNLEYMKELLNTLSDYSNAGTLSLQSTQMEEYLNKVLSGIQPVLEYLSISLETDISPELPCLLVDTVKLRQALLNLLRNAAEAISGPNGKIIFQAVLQNQQVKISVQDNGCGIEPDNLEKIFLPFVTTKSNGTGLGLALTKQIILAHGGQISVQSIPGKGTHFQILLNVCAAG